MRSNPDSETKREQCNLSLFYQSPVVEDPLQVDIDKEGADSDHLLVTITPIRTFNDKKNVVKKKVQFRPLKDHGFQEMGNRLENFDWGNV